MYQQTKMKSLIVDEYGVNEVLAFSLIFALIMSSITLIYTQAYPQLEQQKNVEIDQNVERSLSILQDNFDTVASGTAPSRETELKVGNSKLDVNENGYNITYSFYENGNYSNISISPDVFTYETPTGAKYYYLQGGIVQVQNKQVYFVEAPTDSRTNNGTLQLDLYGMNHYGNLLSGGTHTIVVKGGDGQVVIQRPEGANRTHRMTLVMDTPTTAERDFWRKHYQQKPSFMNCYNKDENTFTCETAPYKEIIISYRYLTYNYQK